MREGKIGQYGGIVTKIKNIQVGKKFHVYNGHWDGEIRLIGGKKYMYVEDTDSSHEITPDREEDYLEI